MDSRSSRPSSRPHIIPTSFMDFKRLPRERLNDLPEQWNGCADIRSIELENM